MAQRYQDGHLRRAKRKRGPDVWEFLWRECGPSGKRRQRTLTVGTVTELRTEREALNRIQVVRTNINRDFQRSALMTFKDLVDHYRQRIAGREQNREDQNHVLGLSQKLDSSNLGPRVPAQRQACCC